MKTRAFVFVSVLALLLMGCKKDDEGTTPPVAAEDWTFPTDTVKFAVTVNSPKATVAVGEAFDVKVILYNVSNAFGFSMEMAYASDKVEVLEVTQGPHFAPVGDLLTIKKIDAAMNAVSYGVTFKAGTTTTGKSGSGVVFKLKCRARVAGSAAFTIAPGKLEIRKADGSFINNFNTIAKENLTLQIQ